MFLKKPLSSLCCLQSCSKLKWEFDETGSMSNVKRESCMQGAFAFREKILFLQTLFRLSTISSSSSPIWSPWNFIFFENCDQSCSPQILSVKQSFLLKKYKNAATEKIRFDLCFAWEQGLYRTVECIWKNISCRTLESTQSFNTERESQTLEDSYSSDLVWPLPDTC